MNFDFFNENYGIDKEVFEMVSEHDKELREKFYQLEDIREYNQLKVINAFRENRLSTIQIR